MSPGASARRSPWRSTSSVINPGERASSWRLLGDLRLVSLGRRLPPPARAGLRALQGRIDQLTPSIGTALRRPPPAPVWPRVQREPPNACGRSRGWGFWRGLLDAPALRRRLPGATSPTGSAMPSFNCRSQPSLRSAESWSDRRLRCRYPAARRNRRRVHHRPRGRLGGGRVHGHRRRRLRNAVYGATSSVKRGSRRSPTRRLGNRVTMPAPVTPLFSGGIEIGDDATVAAGQASRPSLNVPAGATVAKVPARVSPALIGTTAPHRKLRSPNRCRRLARREPPSGIVSRGMALRACHGDRLRPSGYRLRDPASGPTWDLECLSGLRSTRPPALGAAAEIVLTREHRPGGHHDDLVLPPRSSSSLLLLATASSATSQVAPESPLH